VEGNDEFDYDNFTAIIKGFIFTHNDLKTIHDKLKSKYPNTNVVIINPDYVLGMGHIHGILRIINEELNRKTEKNIKSLEVEFLLRLCHTDQISNAFKIINHNKTDKFIVILFGNKSGLPDLRDVIDELKEYGTESKEDLITSTNEKKNKILNVFLNKEIKDFDIDMVNDNEKFLKFLIERSAISLKYS
jgi:tRNA threonylcarbamoyladenosine modification (KEOPS) complex Cgi121 subunit